MDQFASLQDIAGVILAYRFDEQGRARAIAETEAIDLAMPDAGFVWVHLNLGDERARRWLGSLAVVPQPARSVMLSTDNHQLMSSGDDAVWGVFPDLIRDFDETTNAIGHLRFVMGERFLISGRRHALQSIETMRATLSSGHAVPAPIMLFETLVEHATDGLSSLVQSLGNEIDAIEDRVLSDHFHRERAKLAQLRRQEVAIHRQLSGMLSIFRQLAHKLERSAQRDLVEAVNRLIQRIEALHHEINAIMSRTRLLQEEISQNITTETNDHLYALTVLTTMLLPPTLVTGLFGMNTGGLPLKESDWGTVIAIGLCLVSSLLVFLLFTLLQRRR